MFDYVSACICICMWVYNNYLKRICIHRSINTAITKLSRLQMVSLSLQDDISVVTLFYCYTVTHKADFLHTHTHTHTYKIGSFRLKLTITVASHVWIFTFCLQILTGWFI